MMDVVVKKGSWYSYGDHRFVGTSKSLQYLRENPVLLDEIEKVWILNSYYDLSTSCIELDAILLFFFPTLNQSILCCFVLH
ncbi:putative DNA recombination and repair protein RecA [Rosa chinensis]|uniref:Putative DNA recombination and repair protein RecA n=1 Tax=Rosa chinensis TaxID=74649 RepID=A0A2P6RFW5_ROSCH|nr:putative DNA recombination and repair protein RecA [Rosa chinensis]